MTTIYFVRHAHSVYTPEEYTRPLSPNGKLEAFKLVNFFHSIQIDAIYCSNYLRAYETIEPIANVKQLPIQQIEALNERQLSAHPIANFENAIQRVWADPSFAFEGGESNQMAQQRIRPTIQKLLSDHECETMIIGTHGNILTLLLNDFDTTYGLSFWQQLLMPDIVKATFENFTLQSVEKLNYNVGQS